MNTLKDLESALIVSTDNVLLIESLLVSEKNLDNTVLCDALQTAKIIVSRDFKAKQKALADFKSEALPKKIKRIDDARFEIFKAMELLEKNGKIDDNRRGIVSTALYILKREFEAEFLTEA